MKALRALALGAAVGCQACRGPGAPARDRGDLLGALSAMRPQRVIAARLSVPVQFANCADSLSPAGTAPLTVCKGRTSLPSSGVLELAGRASAAVLATGDVHALHSTALIDLLWADSLGKSIRRSISYLVAASKLADSAKTADLLADLAAARIALAERQHDPEQLLAAIEDASHAIELQPMHKAAHFNLALGLDRLGIVGEAVRAWRDIERVDASSEWAREARTRRTRLEQLTVRTSLPHLSAGSSENADSFAAADPQGARLFAWDTLLVRWGTAVLDADTVLAARLLRLANSLGRALDRGGRDGSTAAAVHAIRLNRGSRQITQQLAQAHVTYGGARQLYAATDFTGAIALLDSVIRGSSASPALRTWANFYKASTLAQYGSTEQGITALRRVMAEVDSTDYPAIHAHAHWAMSALLVRARHNERGAAAAVTAQRVFERLGEREHVGATRHVAAMAHDALGRRHAYFLAAHGALSTLRTQRNSRWLVAALSILAERAARSGYHRAAVRIEMENTQVAERNTDRVLRISTRLALAQRRLTIGDTSNSLSLLQRLKEDLKAFPESMTRDRLLADLAVVEGHSILASDPTAAVQRFSIGATHYASAGQRRLLVPTLLLRAHANLVVGDVPAAEHDLSGALAFVLGETDQTVGASQRASLLADARPVFNRLMMIRLAGGDTMGALELLERSRGARQGSASRFALRSQMPAEILINYALVGDTLLIWTAVGARIELTREVTDRTSLIRTIGRVRSLLELDVEEAAVLPDLRRLHDVLVAPIRQRLQSDIRELVVIADPEIAAAPLVAAFDQQTREFLIERLTVRYRLTLADERATTAQSSLVERQPLFVSDPAFDPTSYPSLSRLPRARDEIAKIAPMYTNARVLGDTAAHAAAIAAHLRRATMFHFAGHVLYDDDAVENSELVLAAAGDLARFTTDTIAAQRLTNLRLVVLAGCESARPGLGAGRGFASLTEAFISAGAQAVIGSLWRVDDAATAAVMIAFHRALQKTHDVAAALREAQLTALRSELLAHRSPGAWAGFRLTGS